MTSDEARHVPDRAFRVAQPSLPQPLLYLCGTASDPHKGPRQGGLLLRGVFRRGRNVGLHGRAVV
jgi:hypothetical protein